ncbi:MAG: HD domain-containing protein [Mucilaginibacter polytrichastri]|nr:HD domain-containing protein [Mucilaginibacter polytrichastri]
MNKKKIINDPVYGFISIPSALIFDLIEHPFVQRLRNIKQTGMAHLVYPGAVHTRFHHALGAMHLMRQALETLRSKGVDISPEEEEAATIAILLHDIGHGPFSHALEHSLVSGVSHEDISALMMDRLNKEFNGQLELSIAIFNNLHPKRFLHQLVSGQLDLDRMDYLNRDSFFTGVAEGVISSDRIIKMFAVADDNLVIEEKGIYSVEKFLIARRLMYWQVYLHKTNISAEYLLIRILERAKMLSEKGTALFATPALQHFLKADVGREAFLSDYAHLQAFARLDDHDAISAVKVWADAQDDVLRELCLRLMERRLYGVQISSEPFDETVVKALEEKVAARLGIQTTDAHYFAFTDMVFNKAYAADERRICVLKKDGSLVDITRASDNSNLEALSQTVKKYVLCTIKDIQ